MLIAVHDLNQALRFANKCIVIAGGRMIGCGTPAEVVTPALLRDVYRVEARIERCSRGFDHIMVDGVVGETAATASIAA